jgi:hypothetical protein
MGYFRELKLARETEVLDEKAFQCHLAHQKPQMT